MKPLQAKRLARKGVTYLNHRFSHKVKARNFHKLVSVTATVAQCLYAVGLIRGTPGTPVEKTMAIARTVAAATLGVNRYLYELSA